MAKPNGRLKPKYRESRIALPQKPLLVTEHAFVRYVSRHQPLMFKHVCDTLTNDRIQGLHKMAGEGLYPIEGGGQVVIKNNTIVTVR